MSNMKLTAAITKKIITGIAPWPIAVKLSERKLIGLP